MKKVEVPAAPGRLIQAVASIGYDPEVALCDLMDNSIDANSTTISVSFVPQPHEAEGDSDTIESYIIADDGHGMDNAALIKAFQLGTERTYSAGSLGKFGLGLKSAGLALAKEIVIISKTMAMPAPLCAILRIREVEHSGRYEIDLGDLPNELAQLWADKAPSEARGTLLLLRDLHGNQPPYARFRDYFGRYCSITYHQFLEDTSHPLKSLRINDKKIEPRDPLFLSEANQNGALTNPEDWDGRTVRLLLADQELPLSETVGCKIAATHLVHPPTFEQENTRAEVRDRYMIDADPYTMRPRHGFYIYRNRRVIVMAERFHGVIAGATQAHAFRGRLEFDESADSILALDVKKRHCRLPKEARNNLKSIISTYQSKSVKAWEAAGRREEQRKGDRKEDLANQGIAQAPVVDLEYAPGADLSTELAIEERKQRQKEIGQETLQAIHDPTVSGQTLQESARTNSIVVPVQGMKANAMWLPYPSVEIGKAETLLNKAHTWVSEALAHAEDEPRITTILYQLFTILARAELEVRSTNWRDLPDGATDKVLERFRRKASVIGEDLADTLAAQLQGLADEE